MDRAGRHALLAAGVLAVIAAVTWRERPEAGDPPRGPERTAAAAPRPPEAPIGAAPPKPAGSIESVIAHVNQGSCPPLTKDVLSGPLGVAGGSGRMDLDAPDLPLTASQRTLVEALVRERNAAFEEVRREAAGAAQTRESAERLTARAGEAHAVCVASIRNSLLPEQRAVFDDLVRSNKWGSYVLVIPTRSDATR